MSEWRVELLGDLIDLQLAYGAFSTFDPCIVQDGDKFFLKANEFGVAPDAASVRTRARDLVKIIANAMYLQNRDTRPITTGLIIHIDDDGQQRRFAFMEGKSQGRGVASGTLIDKASTLPSEHNAIRFFRTASNRGDVADALAYFSQGDWINLYKAYEIIKDDIGNETRLIKLGGVSRSELKRFTQTAQSRDAIGDDARHASKKYQAPIKPMSVYEARALIGNLLQKWIDQLLRLDAKSLSHPTQYT
ncbi:MAG: hypothetical protein L0Z70_00795 [Chloroflexi bacterium]|nr:hypothetical protein [Chloroflexota bacterium]